MTILQSRVRMSQRSSFVCSSVRILLTSFSKNCMLSSMPIIVSAVTGPTFLSVFLIPPNLFLSIFSNLEAVFYLSDFALVLFRLCFIKILKMLSNVPAKNVEIRVILLCDYLLLTQFVLFVCLFFFENIENSRHFFFFFHFETSNEPFL